uniref:Reverse transcriptase domain-containing protein n=1 Tax=Tanacetum cinerariifolium TaxID=118510 RepID=A0A6L2MRH7_TANCI|nr:reverse transcriptase domain-containing protein [Tanacetum cinerariifolium]
MPKRLAYADSDKEAPARSLARGFSNRFSFESSGTSDTHRQTRSASKSQRNPSKNKEPAHLRRSRRLEDRSINKDKTRRERSKSRGKRSKYQETSSDSEHEEGIFSAVAEQEEWPIPIWCKMFCQTLVGAARRWFDDLDPKSVDSFEELIQKFLEEFSQQKRYAKDPTEIHDIKKRQNDGLQAFMDRFKSESSHIKGVPPVLRISAFMDLIRGEVVAGSAEMVRPFQGDKGYIRLAWSGGPEKARNKGGLRETRQNIGIYTSYPRKDAFTLFIKTLKEMAMESRNRSQGRNNEKVINMIKRGGSRKRPFMGERSGLTDEVTFPTILRNQLTGEPIILERMIEDHQTKKMQSSAGRFLERNVPPFGNNRPSCNHGKGRTKMRSLRAIGSTIHSMIKFPTNQGILTMEKSKEALWECRHLERVQCSWKEVQWRQREEKMFRIREQAILRTKAASATCLTKVWYRSKNMGQEKHKGYIHHQPRRSEPARNDGDHVDSRLQMVINGIASGKQEGVYCFTHMPKELKNLATTLQRMMEKVLIDQRGRNMEVYLEEIVVKIKSEQRLDQDVEETLGVNIKIDPNTSSFEVEEGKFLGPMVTKEGDDKLRSDGRKGRNPSVCLIYEPTITRNEDMLHPYGKNDASFNSHNKIPEDNLQKTRVKKFSGQGEQVQKTPGVNEGETLNLNKELQVKLIPTPMAWRLYLGKETIKEGSGIGIILVSPDEKMHSYAIRLKFNASDHSMDCKALMAGLFASINKDMKDLYVFIDSLTLVAQIEGSHTPATKHKRKYKEEIMDATAPFHRFRITHLSKILNSKAETLTGLASIKLEFLNHEINMDNLNITMEEYIRRKEEKARKHGKVFNWETAKYGEIWYDEDVHNLRSVETEFSAIVFNDNLTSDETLPCEPTVSSLNNEIDFRISFNESDNEDYMVVFDKNSFSYKKFYQ